MAISYSQYSGALSAPMSGSAVVGGPSLSNGKTVQIRFEVPKGNSVLTIPLRLRNPRPADCLADGTVDIRAVSGSSDPSWHSEGAASSSIDRWVRIKESTDLVVLSVGLHTLGDCRADLVVAPYKVAELSHRDVLIVPLAVGSGLLGVGLICGSRFLVLAFASRRREQSPDWEPRLRLRTAEDRLEEALRRPAPRQSPEPEAEAEADGGQPQEQDLALPALWSVTNARLALYHRIATGQASASFRNAQTAMWTGFVLLGAFTVAAAFARNTTASIVAGALGVTSAGLAGYVSRTFVRSQESAAGHLRAYFDQPLEFSRYLAAERLIADAELTSEQRAEILGSLVRAMVASEGSASGQAPTPAPQPSPDAGAGAGVNEGARQDPSSQ
ncbi:hypothetical protein [Streptomyces sp. NBC_01615]|uniref:hypothetical protein n=1 Tax=Streptomyces sp. NBC_01615 TaxID=2975898 RepID=UPI00386880E2